MTHLGVDKLDTKDIGQEEDRLFLGVFALGRCDVGLDAVDDLYVACDDIRVRRDVLTCDCHAYPLDRPRGERLLMV